MPLLSVNAVGSVATPADPGPTLADRLRQSLATLPPDAPVVLLLHGFRFSPEFPKSNPHTHILALEPRQNCWKATSWPRHLGFGRTADEGLCIGFAWQARGSIWQAYAAAAQAGTALAALVGQIQDIDPGRRVDVVAHSLGARVLLTALPLLAAGSIGRAILMSGAEFGSRAAWALSSPAGQTAEFINITTRENDLFDFLIEACLRAPHRGDRALGQGLPVPARNWLDLQVDQEATLAALAALGHRIAPPHLRVCHWSAYLRPGLFGLYRALLRDRDTLSLALLRARVPPRPEPRWSRLLALPVIRRSLLIGGKAAS